MATTDSVKLRVFFVPFFASGHIIPMVDLARLFAGRPGVEPTMVVTPSNADIIRATLDRSTAAGFPVRLLVYPFPSTESGLSPGIENLASVSTDNQWRIYKAVALVRPTHDRILRDHLPDAVVTDVPFWWINDTAADLGIPCITFFAVGVFPQCVMNSLQRHHPHRRVAGDSDPFVVPELPGPPVELVRSELPGFLRTNDELTETWKAIKKSQMECHGVVVNTFYELEPAFCELYRKTECRDVWFVGPVSLSSDSNSDARGGAAAENRDRCMAWLDKQKDCSVVFVCFGSWCNFSPDQLREIAAGLEASQLPFILVVRESLESMPEKVGRGLVVKGWVPQVEVLGHRAVGVFLTHCGWNSVLEAMAAGVPMLTWPLVFEQFINERLVVGLTGTGARVWEGYRSTDLKETVVVPREAIRKAVVEFMDGVAVEEARRRAKEYKAMAKSAVAEGGSSERDLKRLIDELVEMTVSRRT